MSERENSATLRRSPTRRQMIASAAMAFGSLAAGSELWAKAQQQGMQQKPSSAANQMRTSLHQEAEFKAGPQRVYDVFLDSKQFAACTGMPAEIDPKAGGAFSMFGGMIVGRNVELVPNERIVQAWRPTHWDPGVYSIVRFEFKPQESGTLHRFGPHGIPGRRVRPPRLGLAQPLLG